MKSVRIHKLAGVFCFVLCILWMSGCYKNERKIDHPECKEELENVETYVLEKMDGFISFDAYEIIDYTAINGQDDYHINLIILFSDEYQNDNLNVEKTPIEVMEETRLLINEYLSDKSNSELASHRVNIYFRIPSDKGTLSQLPDEDIGFISNYRCGPGGGLYSGLYFIDYGIDVNIEYLSSSPDIRQIDLQGASYEEVLNIIDRLPDVESVLVDDDLIDELSSARPDLEFI